MKYNKGVLVGWWRSIQAPYTSERYARGLVSYGKKVRTDRRKERIIAELNALGVKPRIRVKMNRRYIGFKAYRASMQGPKRMQSTNWVRPY